MTGQSHRRGRGKVDSRHRLDMQAGRSTDHPLVIGDEGVEGGGLAGFGGKA